MRLCVHTRGAVLLALMASMPVGGDQGTTGILALRVVPECVVAITGSSISASGSGGLSTFVGSAEFTYKIRTSQTGGGAVEMRLEREPGAATPPGSAISPPTLTWSCVLAGPGEARSGAQVFSAASPATIAVFGARSHSSRQGSRGHVTWMLKDAPACSGPGCSPTVRLSIRCM